MIKRQHGVRIHQLLRQTAGRAQVGLGAEPLGRGVAGGGVEGARLRLHVEVVARVEEAAGVARLEELGYFFYSS